MKIYAAIVGRKNKNERRSKKPTRRRALLAERLERRDLLAASVFQNQANPLDVNNDQRVSALDALIVVNTMSRQAETELPAAGESAPSQTGATSNFPDVSGDGRISALDALQVINALAEGEEGDNIVLNAPFAFQIDRGTSRPVTGLSFTDQRNDPSTMYTAFFRLGNDNPPFPFIGTIDVTNATGVLFTAGDGIDDPEVGLTGSLNAVNNAINSIMITVNEFPTGLNKLFFSVTDDSNPQREEFKNIAILETTGNGTTPAINVSAILLDPAGPVSSSLDMPFTLGPNSITRSDGGSWIADGFFVGGYILISDSGEFFDVFNEDLQIEVPTHVFNNNGHLSLTSVTKDTLVVNGGGLDVDDPTTTQTEESFMDTNATIFKTIGSVGPGRNFVLGILAEDTRNIPDPTKGPFSVYVDVNFNPSLVSVDGNLVPANGFSDNIFGDFDTPGLANGIGGSRPAGSIPLGAGQHLVTTFGLTANQSGTANFDLDFEEFSDRAIMLSGNPSAIPENQIMFEPVSLAIVSDIIAVDDALAVNEDSELVFINVLANDQVFDPPDTDPSITDVNGDDTGTTTTGNGGTVTFNSGNVTYTPAVNFNGDDTFTYTISNGQGATDTANVNITVEPINDGPINTVPGSQTIDEDNDLVFSSTNPISVFDLDGNVQVRIDLSTDGFGTINVPTTPGVTQTNPNSENVTLDGLISDLNDALNGLTYSPNLNFNGNDSLQVSTNDLGNTGGTPLSDTDTVNITVQPVNDGPINTVPGPQSLFNTDTLQFDPGEFSVDDVDASELEVNLTVGQGTVGLGSTSGLQITGNNSDSLTASGSITNLNNGLGTLLYDPLDSFIGTDTLTMTTSDGQLSDTDSVSITVTPPEVPFAARDLFQIEEDSSTTNLDVLANDLKPDPQNVNVLNITGTNLFPNSLFASPTILVPPLGGLAIDDGDIFAISDGGPLVTFEFDSDNVVSTVPPPKGITYSFNSTPDEIADSIIDAIKDTQIDASPFNFGGGGIDLGGPATVDVSGSSLTSGTSVADGDRFTINDGSNPAVTFEFDSVGGSTTGNNVAVPFTAGGTVDSIADAIVEAIRTQGLNPRNTGGGNVAIDPNNTFTFDVSNSSLGLTFTTGNAGQLRLQNNSFTYLPEVDFFGTDTFTYTIESTPDAGNGSSTGNVTIEVTPINDGPINSVPGPLSVDEDASLIFTAGTDRIGVADIDAGSDGVTVTLTVGNGTINVPTTGGNVTGNGSGNVSIDGTVSQVNTTLGGLTYTPILNFNGSDQLSINTNDNGNTGGGALSDTDTVNITVQPINDGPTLVVPGTQSFFTDFDNRFTSDPAPFSIDDVDAGNSDVQVDLTIGDGALTINSTRDVTVTRNPGGTNGIRITGTVSNVNNALASGLDYNTSQPGDKSLNVVVDDLGNTGSGNQLTASDAVDIEVLDFVPVDIVGRVFIESPLGDNPGIDGVDVILSGTDFQGNPLNMTDTTDSAGIFSFLDVRPNQPGNPYTITAEQPSFIQDQQADTGLDVTVDVRGQTGTVNVLIPVAVTDFKPEFTPTFDLFGQTQNASGIDIGIFGGRQSFGMFVGPGWDMSRYSNPRLALGSDGLSGVLSVFDNQAGADRTANVSVGGSTLTYRGNGADRIYRVIGGSDLLGLLPDAVDEAINEDR